MGYLCTQLSTGEQGAIVTKGSGCVTFYRPTVNLCPGLFLIDVAAERYPEVIDWRHRCAVIRVDEGPVVLGDLHMPHSDSILTRNEWPNSPGAQTGYQTLINAALREYLDGKAPRFEDTLRRIIREELKSSAG